MKKLSVIKLNINQLNEINVLLSTLAFHNGLLRKFVGKVKVLVMINYLLQVRTGIRTNEKPTFDTFYMAVIRNTVREFHVIHKSPDLHKIITSGEVKN